MAKPDTVWLVFSFTSGVTGGMLQFFIHELIAERNMILLCFTVLLAILHFVSLNSALKLKLPATVSAIVMATFITYGYLYTSVYYDSLD